MRTWDEVQRESLKADAAEAAAYLRAALEDDDTPFLLFVARDVYAARGTLEGLGLKARELQAIVNALLAEQSTPTRKTTRRQRQRGVQRAEVTA